MQHEGLKLMIKSIINAPVAEKVAVIFIGIPARGICQNDCGIFEMKEGYNYDGKGKSLNFKAYESCVAAQT